MTIFKACLIVFFSIDLFNSKSYYDKYNYLSINKYKKQKISKKGKSLLIVIYNKLMYIKVLCSDKVVLVKKRINMI